MTKEETLEGDSPGVEETFLAVEAAGDLAKEAEEVSVVDKDEVLEIEAVLAAKGNFHQEKIAEVEVVLKLHKASISRADGQISFL